MKNKLRQELEAMLAMQTGNTFTADHVHTLVNGVFATDEEALIERGGGFFNVNINCGPRKTGGDYDLESSILSVYTYPNLKARDRSGLLITFWNGQAWENWRYSLLYDVTDPTSDSLFLDPLNWEVVDIAPKPEFQVMSKEEYFDLIDIKPNVLYCLYETEEPESDENIDINTKTFYITEIEGYKGISLGTIENNTLFLHGGSDEPVLDVEGHSLIGITSIENNVATIHGAIENNSLNI